MPLPYEKEELHDQNMLFQRKKQNTNLRQRVFRITSTAEYKAGNKGIGTNLFKAIYNNFVQNFGEKNIRVRALNDTQFFTFKTFDETTLHFEDFDRYYENKVRDPSAFEFFHQIEIMTLTPEPK